MEIIRNYEELMEMAVTSVHPIEAVIERLVAKGVIRSDVARNFLIEIR